MSRDLEMQLAELGPGCREVVERLRRAACVEPRGAHAKAADALSAGIIGGRRGPTFVWTAGRPRWLVAASVLLLLGLAVVFRLTTASDADVPSARVNAAHEYMLAALGSDEAVQEMIRTQNPDGSWKTDFLTRRNAEALGRRSDAAARVAYKKAMRNLRARGVL